LAVFSTAYSLKTSKYAVAIVTVINLSKNLRPNCCLKLHNLPNLTDNKTMSYSDFTLTELENKFNLIIQERVELFPAVEPVNTSTILKEVLAENIPLALEINTEKA